ncbi:MULTISPECIES: radical SAM protein [Pelosinus]|uniref:Radical SAM domain protein n=1 Tax=Pelosinus fermentans B4 TaxID=1149862 RepID=I8RNA5_9FIRM|nr:MULTISPECIES: radical SAM protein [Pelosinus]EIW20530.1 Radical SAM domain protein [Pelosinus fermentans B4]EIW25755.1 Radical SAM domain protein [Pelosinus fermentans A11]OAM93479.1 Radical SAM domain protein [Pelosinus fermentans DSM 17108]SDQ79299.1 Radical SAM superfamily protein [Pelosinus fermentans]
MYFDTAGGPVFRPPSEAESFILRVTIGCSHNRCTYCNMYRSVDFRMRTMDEIMAQINHAGQYKDFIRRIFLADGNALVLPTETLLEILRVLKERFPKLRRVSCYAGPNDILRKTPEELQHLSKAGLKLVYYGMESGDDEVLRHVNKGVTAQQSIEAGQKVVAAGIKLSLMVIIGLGGKAGSRQHAYHTAQAVNAIRPTMLSALTLMMYRGSELRAEYERGEFEILSPPEIMDELHELIHAIDLPSESHCLFRSNHISNYVALAGTLPQDKEKLLSDCKKAIEYLSTMTEWDPYNNVEQ